MSIFFYCITLSTSHNPPAEPQENSRKVFYEKKLVTGRYRFCGNNAHGRMRDVLILKR